MSSRTEPDPKKLRDIAYNCGAELSEEEINEVVAHYEKVKGMQPRQLCFLGHALVCGPRDFEAVVADLRKEISQPKKRAIENPGEQGDEKTGEERDGTTEKKKEEVQKPARKKRKGPPKPRAPLRRRVVVSPGALSNPGQQTNDPNSITASGMAGAPALTTEQKSAEDDPNAPVRATKDSPYIRCVGDWHCFNCKTWNMKFFENCRGKTGSGQPCWATRDYKSYRHEFQQEGPDIRHRAGGVVQGDWFCGECYAWSRRIDFRCRQCGVRKRRNPEYVDEDTNLPGPGDLQPRKKPDDYGYGPQNQAGFNRAFC